MQQLYPHTEDPADLTRLLDRRDRSAPRGRPWVMANMVESVDGAYALDGRSGGLSGDDDKAVFRALRAACDVVLVAAGTARTEQYRRPSTSDPELLAARRALGLADQPRLCLVSRSLELPEDLPLRTGSGPTPLVLHPDGASTERTAGIELRASGHPQIDLDAALRRLHDDGAAVVLCEGGPSLLGQLHELDLIDELFVTVSPKLVGGEHTGLLGRGASHPRNYVLHRVLEANGSLMLTYRSA